jgi:CSLREA domain-containing protein
VSSLLRRTSPRTCAFFFALVLLFVGVTGVTAFPIYAVDPANNLLRFDSTTPGTIQATIAVSGLQPSENIQGIDFRPATAQLYALSLNAGVYRLYIINTTTGAASLVGSPGTLTFSGTNFGFDCDPVSDRFRVITNLDENVVINPNDGTAVAEATLAYRPGDANSAENPNVTGAAYTNNVPGATSTSLFGIDVVLDILTLETEPETGRLFSIGHLGVNTNTVIGFDIADNTAFALLRVNNVSGLYTISLGTGAATLVGAIGNGTANLVDITVALEPQTFVVTSTSDIGDGICNATCTLREAITAANAKPGADVINFNIPGIGGTLTVSPTSVLPSITDAVTIDGYSQPGASANTLGVGNNAVLRIQLSGTNAGDVPAGLVLKGSNSTVRGLIINRWMNAGILIDGLSGFNNVIAGNFIGTNATGSAKLANGDGVLISAPGNILGGTTPGARNLISGNTHDGVVLKGSQGGTNLIQGNYIGTDKAGSSALGNGERGVILEGSAGNLIGGTAPGAGNVIGGNGAPGLLMNGTNNVVQGNLIGTNASGNAALSNENSGVLLNGASSNTIGGATAGARNVISGNNGSGVVLVLGTNNRVLGNYIGTDAAGMANLGNQSEGVYVFAQGNFVGGTAVGEGNLISGNAVGIKVEGLGTTGTRVDGNRIGTTATGGPLGNATGVLLRGASTDTTVGGPSGGANTIAFNSGSGVMVDNSEGNDITGNVIFNNGQLGIDLKGGTENASLVTANDALDQDTGANRLQNYPVLTGITGSGSTRAVEGQLNSAANMAYHIDFYRNDAVDPSGFGEGQNFMGFVTVQTNAQGTAPFSFLLDNSANGQFITATATDPSGNTSEFSMASAVVPGPAPTPTPTPTPAPTPTPTPTPTTTLANISTRLRVESGDDILIGGFIVTGTQPKKVIIRAIGTSLPLAGNLADPTLELHGPSGLIEANDNWVDSPNKQAIIDSTIAPGSDLESAIVQTLPANGTNYTAIVRGVNGGTGIGVVEAYDLDTAANSRLANISTRGFVQTGDNVLIAGTIVVGPNPQKVLIRGIGPSLTIAGKMENPALELRDSNGALLQTNDNWVDSPDKQAIIDTTIPPANDLESAIVATLPGNGASYTAIVRGVNDTTGIAVVEIYALP